MLEEVVAYWRRWDTLSEEFDRWLATAEKALNLPEEEQMEFFQNISLWRDNYQLLGDTVSFLIATCQDKIAVELKDRFQVMSERWDKIYPQVNKYSHAGDILRNRKDFRSGLEALSKWLRKAENVLNTPSLGSMERIREHTQNLQRLQGEVEEIENLFKNISKAFQSLIQDLSRDEVEKMMNTLKQEKEALVKVRALIPAQIHLFNQLLIQQESLEAAKKRLINDSKNKVMNNIIKSVDQASNPDVANMTAQMDQLNDRFEYVTQSSQVWEQKLHEAIRCWHNFSECERVISSWLNQAEKLTLEKRIDSKETVEQHKNFFQSVNERWIHDLIQSAQDLCNCLPKEQHAPILSSVDYLQNKWKEPPRKRRNNLKTKQRILSSKGPLAETQKSLEHLIKISNIYTANYPKDQTLKQSVEKAEQAWHNVNIKIENLKQQLDQVPERWQAYHTKFEEMSKWMDGVDDTLKNILNDVNSMEEFEREKAIFQNVCKEADSKREDMKWLVQTLDSLTSHCPEDQALSEQKQLEALIIRYKNLIPTLEITMVKTDTLSKCYTYRREVKEICQLLTQVREQSKVQRQPESLEVVKQNIKKQEMAISHLDQQRPTVMSLLQRGKELTRDEHAPNFMQQEVKTLETGWTTTYDETVDTLHKLIDTHHVWTNYTEQKQEITELLQKAQTDLQRLLHNNMVLFLPS
ncbi:unnamed protein product [Diabrotica balteata]|uniref:Nesprin-1 spectrin repeats region domain-containing protein n=1 Tax=Diabrotica balteata TaxID=107213 RepID=A0A9N9T3B0_DIABA|nr:unnamed protein product [Diabrotica balteata]